ncbi:GNAT family N-acetyltransferase [Nocardiopsis tropica]
MFSGMTTALDGALDAVLDDPVRASLYGAHARFRLGDGAVVRYHPDVARFIGHPRALSPDDYAALAELAVPGTALSLRGAATPLPPGWRVEDEITLVQYDGSGLVTEADPEAVGLGPDDVDEILDLVARTRPGPFERRTIELGTYLGIRDDRGRLIALAGERLHPPGWTEISAVCTDPDHRGQGLATRLIRAVGRQIRDRGEIPFLHTSADNTTARALYESIGFRLRAAVPLLLVHPPAPTPGES